MLKNHKTYRNKFSKRIEKIKPEDSARYMLTLIFFIFGLTLLSIAHTSGQIYRDYNYLNTNVFGIKESCDDKECFWRLEPKKTIYIPIILNKGYRTNIDMTYKSITEPLLDIEAGNFKEEKRLESSNEFRKINLIIKKDTEEIINPELTKNLSSTSIKHLLCPFFGVYSASIKLKSDADIEIKQIHSEELSNYYSSAQFIFYGSGIILIILSILIFSGKIKTEL